YALLPQRWLPNKAKLPHRPAAWNVRKLLGHSRLVPPAQAGQNADVLPALVGVGDGLGVDPRAGLELPQRLARVDVEREHFAGLRPGEQESPRGREYGRVVR